MSDLPKDLPGGVREPDAQLGVDALDALCARIGKQLDETQGAWARKPLLARAWPVALALLASSLWAAYCLVHGGAVGAAAALATAAAAAAFVAVARAPLHPAWSERAARLSLAAGCLALAVEIGIAYFAPPMEGGDDVVCARAIIIGSLLPAAALALYVRTSTAPARLFHVAAIAGAAFLSSAAAVWAECPSTRMAHVLLAHAAAPLVVAVVVVVALRPMLKGRPLAQS